MSISGIEAAGFVPYVPRTVAADAVSPARAAETGTAGVEAAGGAEFSSLLDDGLQRLEGLHDRADSLAVQAATGDLTNIHDYTLAATEASVTTQLTTAVRNKALESFLEIMRMPI